MAQYLDDNGEPIGPSRSFNPGPAQQPPASTTTPTGPANPSVPGHTDLSPQQYVEAWRQQHPNLKLNQANSQAAWDQLVKDMQAVGFSVALDQRPDGMHKGIMLNGGFVKLADGNDNPTYLPGGDAPSGGMGAFNLDSYNSNPFTSAWPGSFPTFTKAPAYQPTTSAEVLADPGYRFGVDEGQRQIQQSAAAKGLLNTGGNLKDLYRWGNSYSNTFFDNVDARRRADYTTNYGTQTIDPYKYAYQNAMDNYNVFRNRQNDSWSKVFSADNA